MAAKLLPIKLYGGVLGPNPLKVGLILTALKLPFESILIPMNQLKAPEYEAINPNGRLPSIHDPNTNFTIWESGAIIEYLIERYDTEEPRKFSFTPGSAEAQLARSFLYLQTTGQGPYYGQAYWFKTFHQEKIPSAVERYVNEIKRVTGVLDRWLGEQKEAHKDDIKDGPWLVGNKFSFADVAFISWQKIAAATHAEDGFDMNAFPHAKDWYERMTAKESLKAVLDTYDAEMAKRRQAQAHK
jgi:glutathione S-transferase